jgi:23S rRNA (uracil1939-C5)-methyltransferase
MRVAERLRLQIERLSTGGEGVGHADGMVVFVPYAAAGDRLEVEITQTQKRLARARILSVTQPSQDRVDPPCPYYFRCGGCTWQHLTYDAQLRAKRDLVQETLERLGGLKAVAVKPVLGMKDPWRYRNKVQQPVGYGVRPHVEKGSDPSRGLISGFYAANSHDIVPIEDCLVQPELSVRIVNRARALLEQYRLRAYDAKNYTGWIRHLLARTSTPHPHPLPQGERENNLPLPPQGGRGRPPSGPGEGGQALLVFVTRTPDFPHEPEIVQALTSEFPALTSIHQNVQPARSNVILGRSWRRLYGQDYLEERLGPLRFRLSPGAFFQVNSPQAEVLYNVAKAMAGRGERLLDLYAGVGTIALWLADSFKEIGGVEEFPAAVRDAETNAEINGIENVRFVAETAESFLGGLTRDRRPLAVVFDPPRAGSSPAVLRSLVAIRPSPLVYVSCDPGTLARDLGVLSKGGYHVEEIQPVDLFPHTPHIETAVKMSSPRP